MRTYSGGMRRRLDLGASLVGRPRLLLLDEPTTGLDPRSRMELWAPIRNLVADGTDVLLTTQYLEEADQLARHVVIVDHGRVIAAGTPGRAQDPRRPRCASRCDRERAATSPRSRRCSGPSPPRPRTSTSTLRRASVTVDGGADQLATAVRLLDERDIAIDDIGLRRPSLDEVFLALTGRHGRVRGRRPARPDGRRRLTPGASMTTTDLSRHTASTPSRRRADTGAGFRTAAAQTARRTLLQFFRTPQLLVMPPILGALFLFMFRYIFGGAIDTGGSVDYVDFLVPGFLGPAVLWNGMNVPAGVAEDSVLRRPRPAALAADTASRGHGRPRTRRHCPEHLGPGRHRRARLRRRLPDPRRSGRGDRGPRAHAGRHLRLQLAVHHPRAQSPATPKPRRPCRR